MADGGHALRIVTNRAARSATERHQGVCSCGWRSEPTTTAGLAGAAWDAHVSAHNAAVTGGREKQNVAADAD